MVRWTNLHLTLPLPPKKNLGFPQTHTIITKESEIPEYTMRKIRKIILHCNAVRPNQTSSAKQIDRWHRQRGWNGIGYHYVIRRNGSIETGRSEAQAGAHCKGHNANSIGVCYEGGLDESGKPADTRTPAQRESMEALLRELLGRFPQAKIYTHHHFNKNKACPCFEF